MKLLSLYAKNFRNLSEVSLDYVDGVMGFIGPNGSGKSTIVTLAPYFGISGKIGDPEITTKKELIKEGTDRGRVEITFENGGIRYKTTRNLHDAGCSVKCLDDVPDWEDIKGAKAVDVYMQEVIGAPFPVFFNTCWAPQQGITAILTMKHAERVAYFQQVFGVGATSKSRKTLLDYGKGLVEYPDRGEDIKNEETKLAAAAVQIKSLDDQLSAGATAIAASEAEYHSMQELLSKISETEYTARCTAAQTRLTDAQATLKTFEDANNLTPLVAVATPTQDNVNKYAAHQRRAVIEPQIQTLVESKTALGPTPEVQDIGLWDAPLKTAIANVQEYLPQYELATKADCPTCHRAFTYEGTPEQQQAVIAHYQLLQSHAANANQQRDEAFAIIQTQQTVHTQYQHQWSGLCAQHTALSNELAALPDVTGFDAVAHEQSVREYTTYTAELQKRADIQSQVDLHNQTVIVAQGALTAAQEASYRTADQETKVLTVQNTLAGLRETEKRNTAARATEIANKTNAEALVVRFQEEQAKRRKANKMKGIIEQVRDALHPDALPRLVMSKGLHNLNQYIERYMQMFDTDFIARLNDDFDWTYDTLAGTDLSAKSRLSGGQKVILGLCFRFALSDLMTRSVALLTLDEPTNHLDEANQARLGEVIDLVRESAEKDHCVLIATHSPDLRDRCTKVTNVDELS